MNLDLQDRVYIVSGASRGLGYATAEELVADGARVFIASRAQESIDTAAIALEAPDRATFFASTRGLAVRRSRAGCLGCSRTLQPARECAPSLRR